MYSAKSIQHLRTFGYMRFGIYGEVWLWGTVVEHQLGWRAQYAYPKNFTCRSTWCPSAWAAAESRLTTLAAYGCDIFVGGKQNDVPLWFSQTGYDAVGLDLLVQRCESWYARRKEERRIKPRRPNRSSGCGIAVVEHADRNQVHALLWNRARVRIRRKESLGTSRTCDGRPQRYGHE